MTELLTLSLAAPRSFRRPAAARARGALFRRAIRRASGSVLAVVLIATFGCAGRAGVSARGPRPTEIWVRLGGDRKGDGTRGAPFSSLADALRTPGPKRVHVAGGVWEGALRLEPHTELVGTGFAVRAAGPGPVVVAEGAAVLRGVTILGGEVGIDARGELLLEHAHLHGQTKTAVFVQGTRATIRATTIESTSSAAGVSGSPRSLAVRDTVFRGAFERAISVSGGVTHIADSRIEDAKVGIHARGGELHVLRTTIHGRGGPGVYTAAARLVAEDLNVSGHEYGLLLGRDTRAVGARLVVVGSERAGIAIVDASADLEDVTVTQTGPFGGIQVSSGKLTLRRFVVANVAEYGVFARESRVSFADGVVRAVSGQDLNGDGVHIRRGDARLQSIWIQGTGGAGLLAAESARVHANELLIRQTGSYGVVADSKATVRFQSSHVASTAGPAFGALEGASVTAQNVQTSHVPATAHAECHNGARVVVEGAFAGGARPGCEPGTGHGK